MSEYHSTDFSFEAYATEAQGKITLPSITPLENDSKQSEQWDSFFSCHNSGSFFKPRRYLALEFESYLKSSDTSVVLEVGCGHGCSMYPLLETCQFNYIATDYSIQALEILKTHPNYNPERVLEVEKWDVTEPAPEKIISLHPQVILAVFAISAIVPELHIQCFQNMMSILQQTRLTHPESNLFICFRDYAIHDMTMYRHTIRYSEHLYRRNDGTLAYYFTKEYLQTLCNTVGLEVVELEYATVTVRNRKKESCMNRVFIHGVFRLK